jgi:hypothetical protein
VNRALCQRLLAGVGFVLALSWLSRVRAATGVADPVPTQSTATPPPSAVGPVDMVVVGSPADLLRIQALLEPKAGLDSKLRWSRVTRFDAREILRLDREHQAASLRCWVDVSDPKRARLYFAARSGEKFLVRDLELSVAFDAVDRESLAQVLELSIQALLENESVGLTRAQAQELLAIRDHSEAADVAVELRAPARTQVTRELSRFRAALFYAVELMVSGLPIAQGPGVFAAWGADGHEPGIDIWLSGQYQLPETSRGESVGLRLDSLATRAGVEGLWPLTKSRHRAAFVFQYLDLRVGAGADIVRLSPEAGSLDRSVALTQARWSTSLVCVGAAGISMALGGTFQVTAQLFADVFPTRVRYDLEVNGRSTPVFSPWRMRPGLALEFAVR